MTFEIEKGIALPARDAECAEIRTTLLNLNVGESFRFPEALYTKVSAQRSKLQKETAPGSHKLNMTDKKDLFFVIRKESVPTGSEKKFRRIWRTK